MSGDLIVYALIAAGLVFWLRSILGTNPSDKPQKPMQKMQNSNQRNDNVIDGDFALKMHNDAPSISEQIDAISSNNTSIMSIDSAAAQDGLQNIIKIDRDFDLKFFLNAAQDVFAMAVESFADGDRDMLRDLLAPNVYEAFCSALDTREEAGEKMDTEINAINEARIIEAHVEGKQAYIAVKFEAEEVSAIYDRGGVLIAGHHSNPSKMIDVWVFNRSLKSQDPRWLVHETRGGFDGDNDSIPNTDE